MTTPPIPNDDLYARIGAGDWYAIPKAMEAAFRAGGAEVRAAWQILAGTAGTTGSNHQPAS